MQTFFICGTPRSRTAWLANLLTTDKSYCFHELLADYSDIPNIKRCFIESGKNIVGNSDSGNTLIIDKLITGFPNAKIVVIKREKAEVKESLIKSGFVEKGNSNIDYSVDLFIKGIKHIEDNIKCISYEYSELTNPVVCKYIFEYCTGLPFDNKRWELLNNLNIQVEKEFEKKRIEKLIESGRIYNFINN